MTNLVEVWIGFNSVADDWGLLSEEGRQRLQCKVSNANTLSKEPTTAPISRISLITKNRSSVALWRAFLQNKLRWILGWVKRSNFWFKLWTSKYFRRIDRRDPRTRSIRHFTLLRTQFQREWFCPTSVSSSSVAALNCFDFKHLGDEFTLLSKRLRIVISMNPKSTRDHINTSSMIARIRLCKSRSFSKAFQTFQIYQTHRQPK